MTTNYIAHATGLSGSRTGHFGRFDGWRLQAGASALQRASEMLTALLQRHLANRHRRRIERQTYRALSQLSDHGLKDIGVSRSEVRSIARAAGERRIGDDWTVRRRAGE